MEKKTYTAADVTPELIEKWKAEYGEVHILQVADKSVKFDPLMVPKDDEDDIDGGLVGYIRKPTDRELGFAMSKLPAVLEAGKVIVKNCWLAGDEQIKTETSALSAAALQAVELLEVRAAKLKKL